MKPWYPTSNETEGVHCLPESSVLIRTELLEYISQLPAKRFKAVVLRGPPMSGKTSLFDLLEFVFKPLDDSPRIASPEANLLRRTFSGIQRLDNPSNYTTGMLRKELKRGQLPQILLVDECSISSEQPLQSGAVEFFRDLKGFLRLSNPAFFVVCAFVYKNGPVTSGFTFDAEILPLPEPSQQQPGLFLSVEECVHLAKQQEIAKPQAVGDLLHRTTAGHPGMVRALIEYLTLNAATGLPAQYLLLRPEFTTTISKLRIFGCFDLVTEGPEAQDIAKALIRKQNVFQQPSSKILKYFVRRGLIMDGGTTLASPMVEQEVIRQLCGNSKPTLPDTLDLSIAQAIAQMNRKVLASNLSAGVSGLPSEYLLSKEFTLACTAFGPHLFPEVGSVFGIAGRADLWIDGGRDWLIELMRSDHTQAAEKISEDQKEHLDRLDRTNGSYRELPWKDAAVVHFHFYQHNKQPMRSPHDLKPFLWLVDVDASTSEITLCHLFEGRFVQENIAMTALDEHLGPPNLKNRKQEALFANPAKEIDFEWMKEVGSKVNCYSLFSFT